jgi:predicted metalloprotease with PDZ domain
MNHTISRLLLAVLVAALAIRADEPKCNASARECDEQIRKFLAGRRYLGATIEERNPGLVIKSIAEDGPAAMAGMKPGDRLIAVNNKSVTQASTRELKQILADARETGRLGIIVARNGSYIRLQARLEPYSKKQIDKIVAAHLSQSHAPASGAQH